MLTLPENREANSQTAHSIAPMSTSTWQDLAGHWLQNPHMVDFELQTQIRRMAAVQRWRGLSNQTAPKR